MLKETFSVTKDNLSKLSVPSKLEQVGQFSSVHQAKMIEEGQRKVAEFLEEPELEKELMDGEERKVSFEMDCPNESRQHQFIASLIEKLTDMKQMVEIKNVEL